MTKLKLRFGAVFFLPIAFFTSVLSAHAFGFCESPGSNAFSDSSDSIKSYARRASAVLAGRKGPKHISARDRKNNAAAKAREAKDQADLERRRLAALELERRSKAERRQKVLRSVVTVLQIAGAVAVGVNNAKKGSSSRRGRDACYPVRTNACELAGGS